MTGVEPLQAEGTSIIHYKTSEEIELGEELKNEEKKVANSYLKLRDSIISSEELKEEIKESKDPLEFRRVDHSRISKSKQEIIRNALEIVCNQLNAQTAAIFLISKDGVLERAGIHGLDKHGNPLENDWFSEERYQIGKSFTGRAAKSQAGSKYGEIQYTEALNTEDLNPRSRKEYIDKFGDLRFAIAIPLNGRNKTYGVLRVIYKIDKTLPTNKTTLSKTPFSKDEVRLLLFLATCIANALSNFRRDIQAKIFKYLSYLLIRPYGTRSSLQKIYQQVVDLLVQNPETAFKAGILRVMNDTTNTLDVEAISLFPGVTDDRDNSPRKSNDDGFLWSLIVENRKRLILQNIRREEQISQFKNSQWIKKNEFQSFGCFPLIVKNETVGTLSLWTGYNYEFYSDSIDFLQGVADLIASFVHKVKLEEREREAQEKLYPKFPRFDSSLVDPKIESKFNALAKEWRRDTVAISSIIQMSIHPAYQQIIGLGRVVVPLLLRELAQDPDHWFWALRAITGEDPIEPEHRGNIKRMTAAWLEWGKKQGYVFV